MDTKTIHLTNYAITAVRKLSEKDPIEFSDEFEILRSDFIDDVEVPDKKIAEESDF